MTLLLFELHQTMMMLLLNDDLIKHLAYVFQDYNQGGIDVKLNWLSA